MRKKDKELEILLDQRAKLVDELGKTNSAFQKTILAFFTGLATITAADKLDGLSKGPVILFLLQMVIMLVFFIAALLISGNNKRYYVSAIDDYIWEEYGVSVLVFQGTLSRKHTLAFKSLFGATTTAIGFLVFCMVVWMAFAFDIADRLAGNAGYLALLILEGAALAGIVLLNFRDKFSVPKPYKDCLDHLRRTKSGRRKAAARRWPE